MRFSEMQSAVLFIAVLIITLMMTFIFYPRLVAKKRNGMILVKIGENKFSIRNNIPFIISAFVIPIGWHILFSRRALFVGTDTYNYYVDYTGLDKFNFEVGYRWWVTFCNWIGMDFSTFLFVSSLVILFFLFAGLRNYLDNALSMMVALSIYYFEFFFTSMNVFRQMFAVAIFFYAVNYLIDKQVKKYIIFIFLASTFHFSALMTLAFIPISYFERGRNRNKQLYYYLFLLLFLTIGPVGLIFVNNLFSLGYNLEFQQFGIGFFKDYFIPMLLIFFVKLKRRKMETKELRVLENLFLMVIPIRVLGYSSTTISRLSFYPSIIQVILVPLILSKVQSKKTKYVTSVLIVILYAAIYFVVKRNSGEVFPFAFSAE